MSTLFQADSNGFGTGHVKGGAYIYNSHGNPVAWMMGAVTTYSGTVNNLPRCRTRAYGKFLIPFPSRVTGAGNMQVCPARVGKRPIVLPTGQPTWSYIEI